VISDQFGNWTPVSVKGEKVASIRSGWATIVWHLDGDVSAEWFKDFEPNGTRNGSSPYLFSPPSPSCGPTDKTLTWTVPEADVLDASNFIRQSIEATNLRHHAHLVGSEVHRERMRKEAKASELRIDELNRLLAEKGSA
jgi:hypothetical protein